MRGGWRVRGKLAGGGWRVKDKRQKGRIERKRSRE